MKMREASDAIVKEAQAIGEPWVGSAENGVQEALAFFEKHGGLYVETAELEALQKDVDAYFNYQVAKEMGTLIDENAPPPSAPVRGSPARGSAGDQPRQRRDRVKQAA